MNERFPPSPGEPVEPARGLLFETLQGMGRMGILLAWAIDRIVAAR
jgi:hypothetical protein